MVPRWPPKSPPIYVGVIIISSKFQPSSSSNSCDIDIIKIQDYCNGPKMAPKMPGTTRPDKGRFSRKLFKTGGIQNPAFIHITSGQVVFFPQGKINRLQSLLDLFRGVPAVSHSVSATTPRPSPPGSERQKTHFPSDTTSCSGRPCSSTTVTTKSAWLQ